MKETFWFLMQGIHPCLPWSFFAHCFVLFYFILFYFILFFFEPRLLIYCQKPAKGNSWSPGTHKKEKRKENKKKESIYKKKEKEFYFNLFFFSLALFFDRTLNQEKSKEFFFNLCLSVSLFRCFHLCLLLCCFRRTLSFGCLQKQEKEEEKAAHFRIHTYRSIERNQNQGKDPFTTRFRASPTPPPTLLRLVEDPAITEVLDWFHFFYPSRSRTER